MLQSEGHLSAPEAWGEVQREVRAVGHWGRPKLQPAVLQAVDAIGGWRHICFSENVTADRARFLEAYTLLRKREMERLQQIPAVTEVQEALVQGRKKVDTAVAGLLERMNGSGKQSTDNSKRKTVNGKQ